MDENVENEASAIPCYRIVTVEKAPFVMFDKEKEAWSGFCIDMLNYLCGIAGFRYDVKFAPDGKLGSMDENGIWNGMINELKEDRADIALGTLAVTSERKTAVDFTMPFYDLVGTTILLKTKEEETSLFQFATVLDIDVWLCIFGSYLVTSIFVWLFDRWSPFSYQNNPNKVYDEDDRRVFDLKESLWFTMTSITPQGGGEAPKCLSGRLAASTWWLFGFIVLASYTANLAAFLTVSRIEVPLESLDDLLRQYKYEFGAIRGSETYNNFERIAAIEGRFYEAWRDLSLNDSLSELERAELAVWDYPIDDKYTKMLLNESAWPVDFKEAFHRVNTTKFALIGDAIDIKYVVHTHCDFVTIGKEFFKKPYAIAVQKGSPLRDELDQALIKLAKDGILEKLKNQWWNEKINRPKCPRKYKISDGITIGNIGGVFIIIILGIILAVGTLSFEFWWFRCWLPRKHCRRTLKGKTGKSKKPKSFNVKPVKKKAVKNSLHLRKRF